MITTVLAAEVSVVGLGIRLILSLGVVLGLIGGIVWVARRKGSGFGFNFGPVAEVISVKGREQLTRNSAVALLQVGERALLVGVTDQEIKVLAEGDDLLPDEPESTETADDRTSSMADPGGSVPPGMNVIEALREWSVRRSSAS
jgi:flagellar protein FliO/FliZ